MNSKIQWHNKRVLVTGATGLVGGWLVNALTKEGASVVTLIRDLERGSEFIRSGVYKSVSVVNGELEDYSALQFAF